MRISRIYIFFLIVSLFSCREFYEPEVVEIDYGFLVVEGFVEVGGGESKLKLSRTSTIYDQMTDKYITGAIVSLNGSTQGNWVFEHRGEGQYSLEASLPEDQEYQLQIRLEESEHYESAWMKPLISPDIEELYFSREEDGVYIFLNSINTNEEMFFQYTSTEDWEFKSLYMTIYKYDPELEDVVIRDDNINLCYKSEESSAIKLGSSTRRMDGSIIGEEVMRIPLFSEKLGTRYSIEVTQKPLDQMAFEFWESIRKNTDDIGNIFSPLPSILGSNLIKVGDPDTPVIGYISAGKSAKKRLFINFTDIRPWTVRIPDYQDCIIDLIRVELYSTFFNQDRLIPLYETVVEFPEGSGVFVPAFAASTKFCVDCRERGTKEKPDFWD